MNSSWVSDCPVSLKRRIDRSLLCGLKVKKKLEPSKFILSNTDGKCFRCTVGNPHCCSCNTQMPCIHVLFIMQRHFRIRAENPVLWQRFITEAELCEQIDTCEFVRHCVFCRDGQNIDVECVSCGARFHDRCFNLACTARNLDSSMCPVCAKLLQQRIKIPTSRCRHCSAELQKRCYKCMLCKNFSLCAQCYERGKVHPHHPFAESDTMRRPDRSSVTSPSDVTALLYREINPEDYETLLSLDKAGSTTMPQNELLQLPVKLYSTVQAYNSFCPICLQDFRDSDESMMLPCNHVLHKQCGLKWFGKYNNKCPIDHQQVGSGSHQGTAAPIEDADASKPSNWTQHAIPNPRLSPTIRLPFLR